MPVTIGGSGPITGVTSINTTVSDTELGYLDGVSSALQTQINAKANDSSQGLYLITPSSIANSGGSASASGGAVTFSGVTSVSLNGVFSNAYQNYRIVWFGEGTQAPTQGLCLRLRASGTDAAGTNYVRSWIYNSDSAGPTRAYETNNTRYVIGIVGNWSTSASILSADIFMPNASVYTGFATQFIGYSTTNNISGFGVGSHSVATAYDGFTLLAESSGTISGTVRCYGYKN